MIKYSIISSSFNEEENIPLLAEQFFRFNNEHEKQYELIIVDDGSTDSTHKNSKEAELKYEHIKVIRHRRNFGKTEGIITGVKNAEGGIVVIYDTDMQYSMNDIPRLIEEIEKNGYDICTGWKQGKYTKAFVSKVYNGLSRKIFKLPIHDQNGLKAMKKEIFDDIHLRKEWHRYIVSLAVNRGYSVTEVKVELFPRKFGESKYGNPFRVFIGIFDMMTVKFIISFIKKPMLFFGTGGLSLFAAGILTGVAALILRFGFDLGFRPLLYLVMLLVISGLVLFAVGFLAEIIAILYEQLNELKSQRGKH